MKSERYQIRRTDNNRFYFTRTNMKDAIEILHQVEKTTGIEHHIFDTKKGIKVQL